MDIAEPERQKIEGLLKRFHRTGRDAAVARLACTILDSKLPSNADISAALTEVCAPSAHRWRQSAAAIWALGRVELAPQDTYRAVRSLCLFADRKQEDWLGNSVASVLARASGGIALVSATLLLYWVLTFANFIPPDLLPAWLWYVFGWLAAVLGFLLPAYGCLSPLVGPAAYSHFRKKAAIPREAAIGVLGRWKQVAAIGPLAREAGPHESDTALAALLATLEIVTEADYGSVTADDQRSLAALLLNLSSDHQTSVALLRGIGAVCGGPAVPAVKALIGNPPDTETGEQAAALLPVLEHRARLEKESIRLLRACDSATDSAELLRADVESTVDESLLVRAVNSAATENIDG